MGDCVLLSNWWFYCHATDATLNEPSEAAPAALFDQTHSLYTQTTEADTRDLLQFADILPCADASREGSCAAA